MPPRARKVHASSSTRKLSPPASADATWFSRPPFGQPRRIGRQRSHCGLNGGCVLGVALVENSVQQPAQVSPQPDQ